MYRARHVIIVSYVLSNLMTITHFSILKSNLILNSGPLVSKDHKLYHKHISILVAGPVGSHIMLSGSVCIIDDTMTVYMEHFHNTSSIHKSEQLMWISLHILHKLKISSPMT
jgi:hypothetical protein